MATQAQASCFLAKRPDIKAVVCANRPDICAQGDLAVVQWWWDKVLIAPGTPDWEKKQAAGGNLDVFLAREGCPATGTVPPPGGACRADEVRVPIIDRCVDKTTAFLVGGAVVLFILFGGRRR